MNLLGTGSFSRLFLIRFISNNQLYAIKILSKNQLKIIDQEELTKTERDLMVKLSSPFLLNYILVSKLYIVSDFMKDDYIFYHLHIENKFCEKSKILFNGNNIMIRNFT